MVVSLTTLHLWSIDCLTPCDLFTFMITTWRDPSVAALPLDDIEKTDGRDALWNHYISHNTNERVIYLVSVKNPTAIKLRIKKERIDFLSHYEV